MQSTTRRCVALKSGISSMWAAGTLPTNESTAMNPRFKSLRRAVSCLSVLSTLPVIAAPTASSLSTVVVTATRTEQPADQTIASTVLIGRDDIERAGTLTLAELLQRFGGVEIRSTGGAGQPASVFLRGANSNHTLVLVDGLRLNSATTGAAALEHIPIDNIERIEIVKGALSGLYGADALGGVIQVFTRKDAKPRLDASLGVDDNGATRAALGVASTERDTAMVFDAGFNESRAGSATRPGAPFGIHNPDRDAYRQAFASFLLSHSLWQGEKVSLRAWHSKGRADFDDGPGPDTARNTQSLGGAQLVSENRLGPHWTSRLVLGRTDDESRIEAMFGGLFKVSQEQATWQNDFSTGNGHMSAGAEWRRERVKGDTAYDKTERETVSVFAGYSERLHGGQFEFNLRRDEIDGDQRKNTGALAYALDITPSLRAHIRGARAFRLPSFNDLYFPGFSNAALKPEVSDQGEGGVRVSVAGWRLSAVYFSNQIRDLIAFDTVQFKPGNLAKARITGYELESRGEIAGINLRAALTRQNPIDRATGKLLQGRARQFGSLDATTTRGAWTVGANLSAVGHRFDSRNEAAGTRLGGYTLMGLNARYRYDKRWSFDINAQNVTDKRYELARGYETPRRSVFLNVRVVF
jgi:vitamin B12 transporter